MLFVSSYFGWVVFLACLVPSLSDQPSMDENTYVDAVADRYDVTDECREEVLKCSVPVLIDYLFITDPEQLLRRVKEIELYRHCGQLRKSWNCYRDLVGEDQCSRMSPEIVMGWKTVADPVGTDIWKYVCRKEFKNFKASYRCLLTEEVFRAIGGSNCSRNLPDPGSDIMLGVSQAADCVGSEIAPICGAKAGEIVKGLILTVARRVIPIIESQSRRPNEIPTGGEFVDQLDMLKKMLWRK